MANLADQLRSEIREQQKENTKSFEARREYVINAIRGGEREVFISLSKSFSDVITTPSRALLDSIGVPQGWKVNTSKNIDGKGIYYRNGKHYMEACKRADSYPHVVVDSKEYCVEDADGFWRVDYAYNREELLDLGDYFEREGFQVSVNLCSDSHARYPYKWSAYNIDSLIVSL